jgi:type IV pilus assembly protein PilM
MFKGLPGIGLDVGPDRISVIWLNERRKGYQIRKYGCIDIPTGYVNGGIINDPEKLGELINILVERLGFRGQKVATAISGPQIYMRFITVPKMKLKDLKAAAYYKASTFLPLPVEEIVMDIYPLRYYQERGSNWCELFFLAVPKQSVKFLQKALEIAGLKPGVVEIEPLSLMRAWGGDPKGVIAVSHVTSSKLNLSVFINGAPVFNRITDYTDTANEFSNLNNPQAVLSGSSPDVLNITRIARELNIALEYYKLQAPPELKKIENIILCGRADLDILKAILEEKEAIDVQIMDLASQLRAGEKTSEQLAYNLSRDYPVAFGLAARRSII